MSGETAPHIHREDRSWDFGIAAMDQFEETESLVQGFITASSFPKEIREKLLMDFSFTEGEYNKILEEAAAAFKKTKDKVGAEPGPEIMKSWFAHAFGREIFRKLNGTLVGSRVTGELPEGVQSAGGMSPQELKDVTDAFIRQLFPILIKSDREFAPTELD